MQLPRTLLRKTGRLLALPFRWLAGSRDAVFYLAAAGAALVGGLFFLDSSRVYETDPFPGKVDKLPVFLHVRHYAFLLLWALLPAFVAALLRFRIRRPTVPIALASGLVFAIWASSEYFLSDTAVLESLGVVTSPMDTFFRLTLTGGLILSPPLLMILYARCPSLDRYVLRQFLVPFAFCFIGFFTIWLIFDLSDNVGDFNKDQAKRYDLRLMAVDAIEKLPMEKRSLVVVAFVGPKLHVRIFRTGGKMDIDKPESELLAGKPLEDLRALLGSVPLPDGPSLSSAKKRQIIRLATIVADYPQTKFSDVLRFYIVQVPQIVVLIAPVSLLLALLYSLGKMSKTNEIISMLTAGKSLHRILRPLFFAGVYASLICLALNYEWAPQAEGVKETIHDSITSANKRTSAGFVNAQLYRNRNENRTWFAGRIPFDMSRAEKIENVFVFQEDADGRLKSAYLAEKASWIPRNPEFEMQPTWRFLSTTILDPTNPDVSLRRRYLPGDTYIPGWSETPWQLLSGNVTADHLGAPALAFHLRTNPTLPEKARARYLTHWHNRWAAPWSCLVIVLFAAPLGIVFTRRSVFGGVAYSIFIFFGFIFNTHLFLALGQGGYLPPFLGAWTTNLAVAAVGLILLHFRSRNRNIPKPTLANLKSLFKGSRRRRTRSRLASERPEFI